MKLVLTLIVALSLKSIAQEINSLQLVDSVIVNPVDMPDKSKKQSKFFMLLMSLDSAYSNNNYNWSTNTDLLYVRARNEIVRGHKTYNDKVTSKSNSAFSVCSLFTIAALVQMEADTTLLAAKAVSGEVDSLTTENLNCLEAINGIEKTQLLRLEEELNEEQQKAAKLQQEVTEKFYALQSKLIDVKKDARGTIISMSDILFDINKASLTPELKNNLAKIAGILTVYKEANVVVEGHTDSTGSQKVNEELSQKRALNVVQFLIEQGVSSQRLSSIGYSYFRPVATNTTKEGRQKNRRVDLIVQEKKM